MSLSLPSYSTVPYTTRGGERGVLRNRDLKQFLKAGRAVVFFNQNIYFFQKIQVKYFISKFKERQVVIVNIQKNSKSMSFTFSEVVRRCYPPNTF